MRIQDIQLYFAGLFNSLLGCGGAGRAEKFASLSDRNFARVLKALNEVWHDAQERSRIWNPSDSTVSSADGRMIPVRSLGSTNTVIRKLLDDEPREWTVLLRRLPEEEWHAFQCALRSFRALTRPAKAA